MGKKELRERLTELAKARGFVCEAPSGKVKDLQLTFNQKELVELIDQEVDKAREEGRREVIHKLKEEIDMAEVSKFIDAHQDFFNSFGKSVLLKISKLSKKK